MNKPAQSKVVDTIGEEAMATMDEATLHRVTAMITEESKDRNLLSPGKSEKPNSQALRMITDISSSSVKVSHKYEYPKYLT